MLVPALSTCRKRREGIHGGQSSASTFRGAEDAGASGNREASGEGGMDCVFVLQGNRLRRTVWGM